MKHIGHRVIRLATTTSTIEVARQLIEEGAAHGTVVMADRQTAGHGRRGKSWITIPDKSLAATVILRELPEPERLTLASMVPALALVRAVRSMLGVELRTKWPNDVVYKELKVAGSLAEMYKGVLLLSLGANINGVAADLPTELLDTATTLELLAGRPLDAAELTNVVLDELDAGWQTLLEVPDTVVSEWIPLDSTIGHKVLARLPKRCQITGSAVGIDERGRLLVRKHDGSLYPLDAADVTLSR